MNKDKPENYMHICSMERINDGTVEGIQPGIQQLQSLKTDQCEQTWQTSAAATGHGHCVQTVQLEVGQLRTRTGQAAAAEYIK